MWWEPAGISLVLIALAEMGDKSQLVCMVLAARHNRARPVLFGAAMAFGILNALAVLFGTALAVWLPQGWVLTGMAALFAVFGIHSLLRAEASEGEEEAEISGHGLFITAFMMIFLSELGDKTQFAVVGLAGIYPAAAVWLGATMALVLTSTVGALAGKTILRRLPIIWLHRLAGVLFMILSVLAAWRLLQMD
ncbi:MAG: TMEM165/GDT1 family protein [Rhodospirillales bacterium]|nr:TMEM165/GDT1 family protein [Rhodospirillales bacterium]